MSHNSSVMAEAMFRTASFEEVVLAIELAAAEGWNPGIDDAAAFHAADKEGFFVAEQNGEAIATISVVNHNESFAYVGLYICKAEHRGKGIGLRLWNHAMDHAGNRSLGLDGVEEQQANYAKHGFVPVAQSLRFEGKLEAKEHPEIRPASSEDSEALIAADAAANGYAREAFMRNWVKTSANRKTMVLGSKQECLGFATIRACLSGVKIGPIVSDGVEEAISLARSCLAIMPSEQVIIDTFAANTALISYLRGKEFVETFSAARMYRGTPPKPGKSAQALATLELG